MVECDLHQCYGIDMGDRLALAGRTWRWLHIRIIGLVQDPKTRLARALTPDQPQQRPRRRR